jgi:hypothetical protein
MVAVVVVSVPIPVAPPIIAISVPAVFTIPIAIPVVLPPPIVTLIPAFATVVLVIESVKAVSILIHPNLFETLTVATVVLVVFTIVVDHHRSGVPVLPGPPATVIANFDPAGMVALIDDPARPGIPVPVANVDGSNHRPITDTNVRSHTLSSSRRRGTHQYQRCHAQTEYQPATVHCDLLPMRKA